MCETVFIPAPKNQNPQKPIHTPRQLSQPPATPSKQTTSLRPAQSAHLFRPPAPPSNQPPPLPPAQSAPLSRPPAALGLSRVPQLPRHFGRAAQPASVT